MKTESIRAAYIVVIVLCGLLTLWSEGLANPHDNGIVVLPEYEHGVAFCGNEFAAVVHKEDAHVWEYDNITFVINQGHMDDPQVQELQQLAYTVCAQYK